MARENKELKKENNRVTFELEKSRQESRKLKKNRDENGDKAEGNEQ